MCFFYQQQPSELFEYNILFINFKRLVTEEFVEIFFTSDAFKWFLRAGY